MSYTTFSTLNNDAMKEPMFFGNPVNVARYDQQKFEVFEKLTEKQLSFFWRPEEIDVSRDRIDFLGLPDHEKHIFISNLKYQTLLDSIQGRSPNMALLPIVSLPELETWIETWSFSETIHSRSYTHILRNIFTNPSEIFDDIVVNEEILKRAKPIAKYYDDLIQGVQIYQTTHWESGNITGDLSRKSALRELKKKLYLCICSTNALEAIRFYVSFACSFAFAERDLLEGNAKIIKLIARDEALHLNSTQQMLNLWADNRDDPEMAEIALECRDEGRQIFLDAVQQEKDWSTYLFQDGSMIGLNEAILNQYIEYIANLRMKAIGYDAPFDVSTNPIPWINSWLVSDNVQVAPQEAEISSYLVGQINTSVSDTEFDDFLL